MQTQEIVDAIFDVKTNGELSELLTAIRDARKALALKSSFTWYIGQEVNVVERNKTLYNLYVYWLQNKKNLGSTAWALYNSMTEWATHQPPIKRTSINNVASIRVDRLEKVRKTLNNKMLPMLKVA